MSTRERFKLSASVFMILKKSNKVLLLKRSNTGWMDGLFSVPAGAIDGKETLLEAVMREVQEEIGVAVEPKNIRLVHTMHCFTGSDEWLGQYFITESWEGEHRICEPEKHSELQWVAANSLPDTVIPYVGQAIDHILKGISYSSYRDNK